MTEHIFPVPHLAVDTKHQPFLPDDDAEIRAVTQNVVRVARFFDRSDDTKTFKRGIDACNNPGFYRQLGHEPDHVVTQALRTLLQRFSQKAG